MSDLAGRTCLVTGASGFVGGWLTERLLDRGARVRCLARSSSRLTYLPIDRLDVAIGDLSDSASLSRAVAGVDYVFHLGGQITAREPADYFRTNYLGTINLFEACRRDAPGCRRVVFTSSLAAAGPSPPGQPLDESCTSRPLTPYGKSKLLAERAARSYGAELPITVIRPPSVYGPRDRETLQIIRVVAAGVRPVLARGGALSAVHVADLVNGLVLAACHPRAAGKTYYITGDDAPSPNELVDLIGRTLGHRGAPIPLSARVIRAAGRFSEVIRQMTGWPLIFDRWKAEEIVGANWACSGALAKAELGYRPAIALADGLRETICWYREAGWL